MISAVLLLTAPAVAAPLTPTIVDFDFNFGSQFVYDMHGIGPDTLVTAPYDFAPGPGSPSEVTALFPAWPSTAGSVPVWYDDGIANSFSAFGGDLTLNLIFNGHDEIPPHLNVSLTGTGGSAGADLEIWSNGLGLAPIPGDVPNKLLFAFDIQQASLYGYNDFDGYVLEAEGIITEIDPELFNLAYQGSQTDGPQSPEDLIGQTAVVRGHIDLPDTPEVFPEKYDPLVDYSDLYPNMPQSFDGVYSGETGPGWSNDPVPEPATLAMLAIGGVALVARRVRTRRDK
jgi:hypothetical protein